MNRADVLDMERRLEDTYGPIPRRRMRAPIAYVYFIQAKHGGPVKIGVSTSPSRRLASLQTAHAYELVIRRMVPCTVGLELELHARFADLRLRGEWFTARADLLDYIASLPESPEHAA